MTVAFCSWLPFLSLSQPHSTKPAMAGFTYSSHHLYLRLFVKPLAAALHASGATCCLFCRLQIHKRKFHTQCTHGAPQPPKIFHDAFSGSTVAEKAHTPLTGCLHDRKISASKRVHSSSCPAGATHCHGVKK